MFSVLDMSYDCCETDTRLNVNGPSLGGSKESARAFQCDGQWWIELLTSNMDTERPGNIIFVM